MRRIASHAAAIVIGIAMYNDSPALFLFEALLPELAGMLAALKG